MNVKVPGSSAATGKTQFPVRPDGTYVLEIKKILVTDKPDAQNWRFDLDVLDGPEDKNGKSMTGKTARHFITIPLPNNPKYTEDWNDRSVNELVAIYNAIGVKIKADSINTDTPIGKTFVADSKVNEYEKDGVKVRRDQFSNFRVDEDAAADSAAAG